MNGFQAIKRQLLPLLKGLPFIALVFFGALFAARKTIQYTPNSYQTIARIKLDDQKYGLSNNSLYQDFDLFSTENKIQSEAMVLKSPLLVGMALDSLPFDIALYRKGQLRNTMLYDDSPIVIKYDFINEALYDKDYFVQVTEDGSYRVYANEEDTANLAMVPTGQSWLLDGGVIEVSMNTELIEARKLDLKGEYIAHIFSRDGLIHDVSERLDVVEVDKEIAILRVAYKDQHPQKVADLANQLCRTYIQDYVQTKSSAANQTVGFIDEKINEVQRDLQQAEIALEQYKSEKGIVNTLQETETGLRQISSLEVSLINLEMNERAILELEEYISNGDYFNQTAINFGFGDLLMTELVKKLKMWQDERHDLLLKYTEESDKVKNVDLKIEELKTYIIEAIKRNKAEISTKRMDVERSLELASHQFDGLSTKEKELRILERNFHLLEQVFNFLSQKKIEASIAASANLAFHRIIETAVAPKKPIAPNKTLITFVSGLLGLIIGISLIYVRQMALARVTGKLDVEKNTSVPVLGAVRSKNTEEDVDALIKSLHLKGQLVPHSVIAVGSTISGEGKTFIAEHLAQRLNAFGKNVCLLKLDIGAEALGNLNTVTEFLASEEKQTTGFITLVQPCAKSLDWQTEIEILKAHFDVIVIDAPATAMRLEGIEALKAADMGLFILRVNKSSTDYITTAETLQEEYGVKNLHIVLNGAHSASNYNGSFVGTRFRYKSASTSNDRLVQYLNTYFR